MPSFNIVRFISCRRRLLFLLKLLTIYAIIVICILPLLEKYMRFSKLYQHNRDSSSKNVLNINLQRREQALDFLKTLNATETRQMYLKNSAKSNLRFVIGAVTISRNKSELDYLTQVLSRLHQVLSRNGVTDDVFLFICNVDSVPRKHTEATKMATFFPNITRMYSPDRVGDSYLRRTRHSSEIQDYAFCLHSSLKFKPKYVLLIEDDAYPHEDFYEILDSVLRTKIETRIQRGEVVKGPDDWVWLKLSLMYYRNDFHREPFSICQWVALTTLVAGSVTLTFYIYHECRNLSSSLPDIYGQPKLRRYYYIFSAYIIFVFSFIFFFGIIWTVGRPYYLKLRGISHNFYSLEPGTSCCTQAVLYPYDKIPEIVHFLRHGTTTGMFNRPKQIPMDWAMDEYRREKKFKQYLLTPNIFTHIGFYSTLNLRFNSDRAFAYEYFND